MYSEWNTSIFCEPINTDFHIRAFFYPFWANMVQRTKIACLRWNLVYRLIWICLIRWCCSLFCFRSSHFGQISSKKQNGLFKLNFDTQSNLIILNSIVIITFSLFHRKYHFWANLVQKFKIVCLFWNLEARLTRIKEILWWCSSFLLYTGNTLFWANFVQKIKIVCKR